MRQWFPITMMRRQRSKPSQSLPSNQQRLLSKSPNITMVHPTLHSTTVCELDMLCAHHTGSKSKIYEEEETFESAPPVSQPPALPPPRPIVAREPDIVARGPDIVASASPELPEPKTESHYPFEVCLSHANRNSIHSLRILCLAGKQTKLATGL
jgi:hypothetical protein